MDEKYKLSFKNIEELCDVCIYFSDIKNILNCIIEKNEFEKKKLKFNPKISYGTSELKKIEKINKIFLEQISKIQKRKKIIFDLTIKGKDAFLRGKNDNKSVDYNISVLDFFNYFGDKFLNLEVIDSEIEKEYLKISQKIVGKLVLIYKKRCEEFEYFEDFSENYEFQNSLNIFDDKKSQKIVAIFLNDVYSVIEDFKNKEILKNNYYFDKQFIFLKVYFLLFQKFNFVIPILQNFNEKNNERKYEKFVTIAFFDEINFVNIFLDMIILESIDIDIKNNKNNFFDKKNIEIKREKIFNKDKFKYHRILEENIKYIFFNINLKNEIIINSFLFKNFLEFLKLMNGFEKIILYGEKKLKSVVEIKNFRIKTLEFSIYTDGEYFATFSFLEKNFVEQIKNIF